MQGHVLGLGAGSCGTLLETIQMIWPHTKGEDPRSKQLHQTLANALCTLLGQVTGEALERCKTFIRGKMNTGGAGPFQFNTVSRSKQAEEPGYKKRYFIGSEKVPWTVHFPAYAHMTHDFTADFIKAATWAEKEDPKASLAISKTMFNATEEMKAAHSGIWPSMLSDDPSITPAFEDGRPVQSQSLSRLGLYGAHS